MEKPKFSVNRRDIVKGAGLSSLLIASGCTRPSNQIFVKSRRYADRPAMMAIGDSLYQGVRSLSYTSQTSPFSPPALVAETLGITEFAVATPSRPVLWDIEEILRRPGPPIIDLAFLPTEVRQNAGSWFASQTWSSNEAFDNISVGGAEIDSLYLDTYDIHWTKFESQLRQLFLNPVPFQMLSDMWYSLDVCFTLNPRRREEQSNKSQLRQVFDRKPKTLLVNIGSNEGLFSAAFLGDIASANHTLPASMDKMKQLANELAGLPKDVETIVFNSLVRPRTATNLMPADKATIIYPNAGYFEAYGPWLFSDQQTISRYAMRAFDQLVQHQNQEIQDLMRQKLGSRLVYVDLYQMSDSFDGKHYKDRRLDIGNQRLENVPLNGRTGAFGGGLTGLDNMHPTVPGYALIADAVLAAMGKSKRTDKTLALSRDTLLSDIPPQLKETHVTVLKLAEIIRALGKNGIAAQPDSSPAARSSA